MLIVKTKDRGLRNMATREMSLRQRVLARKGARRSSKKSNLSENTSIFYSEAYESFLARKPVLNEESMTVTLPNGDRFFLKVDSEGDVEKRKNAPKLEKSAGTKNDANGGMARKEKSYVQDMVSELAAEAMQALENEEAEIEREATDFEFSFDNSKKKKLEESSDVMLVDKYAPKNFSELVSNEKINREVLRWVKMWDPFVFPEKADGKKKKTQVRSPGTSDHGNAFFRTNTKTNRASSPERNTNQFNREPFKKKRRTFFGNGAQSAVSQLNRLKDERPEKQILLLCGPPGSGKTTLAHAVAKHAGYRATEINGSDERTVSVLKARLEGAMTTQSMFGDSRPNLVILDEIEGAANMGEGAGAINMLVNLTESRRVDFLDSQQNKHKKKKEKAEIKLTRPLICICNDLYSPVLRKLRQCSVVIQFKPASTQRLVQRLKQVCVFEKFDVRETELATLCARMDNDVRSCLHAMQFAKAKAIERIRKETLSSKTKAKAQARGVKLRLSESSDRSGKDQTKSMWDVWRAVFADSRRRKTSLSLGLENSENSSAALRVLQKHCTDFDIVLNGLHENFLANTFQDHDLHATAQVLDWLCFADAHLHRVKAKQEWTFCKFLPFAGLAVKSLCRSKAQPNTHPSLTWPQAMVQFPSKVRASRFTGKCFTENVHSGSFLNSMSPSGVSLDVISPLRDILAPKVRPVSVSLLSKQEKQILHELAKVLTQTGLRYATRTQSKFWKKQSHAKEDSPVGALVPEIHKLAIFSQLKDQHRAMPRQIELLAMHEADLLRMRLLHANPNDESESPSSLSSKSAEKKNKSSKPKTQLQMSPQNAKAKEYAKLAKERELRDKKFRNQLLKQIASECKEQAKDFFGRPIESNNAKRALKVSSLDQNRPSNEKKKLQPVEMDPEPEEPTQRRVNFKFVEGFSDAVRRPVNIMDW